MTDAASPNSGLPRMRLAPFSRYLPVESDALAWGLHVIDAGYAAVPPGSPYPASPHPDGYMFTWDQGRELSEYQMVYITRGSGVFESRETGLQPIAAGSLFLLFPGTWHRYRPDDTVGWDENWIGFAGVYADQLMSSFFTRQQPILQVGDDSELLMQVRSVPRLMQTSPPGYRQMMAGNTIAALARARGLAMREHASTGHQEGRMDRARLLLLAHAADDIDLPSLARDLGYSYSRFRTVFKNTTGMSPRQYQIQIRINRARDLLAGSDQSISEIADQLGFCSVYYFSRIFKQKTGSSPSELRRRQDHG